MSLYLGNTLLAGVATPLKIHNLFDFKWADYELSDQNWLRADTYSWQNGTVYSDAYNHLVDDIDGKTATSETIGSYTISYYLADDGHKITTDEATVLNIYNQTGVAWYYILDTANQRFKLPRENPAREELIQVVRAKGNGEVIEVKNLTSEQYGTIRNGTIGGVSTVLYGSGITSGDDLGITTDSTKSGIISSMTDSTSVYKGKKYLYFYVGQFSQSATEQTAGLNAELFNDKMDRDMSNMNASVSSKETIVGWGIPDYTAGTSLSLTEGQTYVATYNQMICGIVAWGTSQSGEILVRTTNNTSSMSNIIFAGRGSSYDWGTYHLYLKKGQSIYVQSLTGTYSCTVYPLIGG